MWGVVALRAAARPLAEGDPMSAPVGRGAVPKLLSASKPISLKREGVAGQGRPTDLSRCSPGGSSKREGAAEVSSCNAKVRGPDAVLWTGEKGGAAAFSVACKVETKQEWVKHWDCEVGGLACGGVAK
jgi:hypothetical protein